MEKNSVINIEISDVTIEGVGIGRYENMAVFVPKTAVGDEVQVRIIKMYKSYAVGKIEKILKPSKDRIDVDCECYGKCGGCCFRHITYEAELKVKYNHVLNALEKIGGFKGIKPEPIIGSKQINFYRNKSQIPLGKNLEGKIISGFFSNHSHRIIECESCLIHPREFNVIIEAIKKWMKKFEVPVYDEKNHSGLVRHIYIRYAESTKELMVCLVINSTAIPFQEKLVDSLKALDINIVSVCININREKTNVILGKEFKFIWGKDKITDYLLGLKFDISPASFYQVNKKQTEVLYSLVKDNIESSKNNVLFDLYCGIGTIGLSLSSKVSKVVGIEVVEEAVKDATQNAKQNNIKNAKFVCADAIDFASKFKLDECDEKTIIIDPPRKGCTDELIQGIIKMMPERLIYVSCNPATLARDLKKFSQGGFKVQKVIPVDMFPRSCHVETVVLLSGGTLGNIQLNDASDI